MVLQLWRWSPNSPKLLSPHLIDRRSTLAVIDQDDNLFTRIVLAGHPHGIRIASGP
jgi:hypothetical protein